MNGKQKLLHKHLLMHRKIAAGVNSDCTQKRKKTKEKKTKPNEKQIGAKAVSFVWFGFPIWHIHIGNLCWSEKWNTHTHPLSPSLWPIYISLAMPFDFLVLFVPILVFFTLRKPFLYFFSRQRHRKNNREKSLRVRSLVSQVFRCSTN